MDDGKDKLEFSSYFRFSFGNLYLCLEHIGIYLVNISSSLSPRHNLFSLQDKDWNVSFQVGFIWAQD